MLLRTLIAISAAIIVIGLGGVLTGRLSGENAAILVSCFLALIWLLFPLSWALTEFENQGSGKRWRTGLATVVLIAVGAVLAQATIRWAPTWFVEQIRRPTLRSAESPAPALAPNLAPLPSYPSELPPSSR